MTAPAPTTQRILNAAVIVAALGYFVDIYDLLLFGFVRVKSLQDLGFQGQALTDTGISLLNWQMAGMLLGGLIWGVLGDKKGRVRVLYFSIFLYSIANILNGFATSATDYAIFRFMAGIGLAGELGAGITLVSEVLPREKRGYGTMIVASIGLSGALLAWVIDQFFPWRTCYFVGGGLGLMLLLLRISVSESGMFQQVKTAVGVSRGNFLSLFTSWDRFSRFVRCLLIGFPTWYVVGVLITLAPEFGHAKGLSGITGGNAIAACYTGLILGDIASGLLSQYLKSRLKVMWIFLTLDVFAVIYYLAGNFSTPASFYVAHFLLGISVGFWVARTKNGSGKACRSPPAVTACSCMTSSKAAWVLGVARLISSTRRRFLKTGPCSKRRVRWPRSSSLTIWVPRMSAGMRSGVHWTRPGSSPTACERTRTRKVLPSPGTPSRRT